MRRRVAMLGALAVLLIAAEGDAGSDARLDDHGWWWAMQTGLVELPPPSSVPEDGLYVANGAQGETAIAGVRYELDDDDALGATLVLEVAEEQGGDVAGIRACAAVARWRGAQAGTWEHRPSSDCDAAEVSGERDEDGETWSFDLAPFVSDGVANLILEPGPLEQPDEAGGGPPQGVPEDDGGEDEGGEEEPPAPAGPASRPAQLHGEDEGGGEEEPDSAPFQVAFEPPQDESVEVAAGFGSSADFEAPDPQGRDFATGGDAGDESDPDDVPAPREAGSLDMGSGPSSSGEPAGGSADPPEVAGSEQPQQDESVALVAPDEGGDGQAGANAVAMQPSGFGEDPIRQLAALVALVAGAGALVAWRSPARLSTGLAGLSASQIVRPDLAARTLPSAPEGEHTARGLGRFRRPRDGQAPPL